MSEMTRVVVAAGAFAAVEAMALAVWWWRQQPAPEVSDVGPRAVVARPELPRLASTLGALARPDDPAERETLRSWLAQAGFHGPRAMEWYLTLRVALALAAPALLAVVAHVELRARLVLALAAAATGYYLPRLIVAWLRHRRQRMLQRAVPNMMDMLVSCLESGLGASSALQVIAREMEVASPVLADELRVANAAMTAGVSRTEALREMDRRTGIEELTALVSVLSQAERFGAGVADSIRSHARLARRRRALEAEQRAAQAAPYLTVAMVVFIMPALFVVLVGPTVVHIVYNFFPHGPLGVQ